MHSPTFVRLEDAARPAEAPPWLCGEKTRGLVDLARIGLPVPDAVFVDVKRVSDQLDGEGRLRDGSLLELREAIESVERAVGTRAGEARGGSPLLFALRFESKRLNPELPQSFVHVGLRSSGDADFDRRLADARRAQLERILGRGADRDVALLTLGEPFEQVRATLELALRLLRQAPSGVPPVVIIQQMIFGSASASSSAGMAYTRHPYTGEEFDYGRFQYGVDGCDFANLPDDRKRDLAELRRDRPKEYEMLRTCLDRLEDHYRDVRYVEFVIERGALYLVQNTTGNRTPGIFEPRPVPESA